ncbi:hypothetical protein RRG08_028989 [Elysia crispata]|uniref:Uncharacterized protein n=1 Tax=Elysia crispata TaxID=231223 RepID=A0AAE1BEP1_9GAST|nr:hypothetical protein RRG08_028989 [Elysia crispata]
MTVLRTFPVLGQSMRRLLCAPIPSHNLRTLLNQTCRARQTRLTCCNKQADDNERSPSLMNAILLRSRRPERKYVRTGKV